MGISEKAIAGSQLSVLTFYYRRRLKPAPHFRGKAGTNQLIEHPVVANNIKEYANYLETHRGGYELPDIADAKIFKNMVDKYKGKVLIVDFWAEWCAPCSAGIEAHLADREKYADHPYFAFLFVTDESSSEIFCTFVQQINEL